MASEVKVDLKLQMRPCTEQEIEEVCTRFIGWPIHPLTELAMTGQLADLLCSKIDTFTVVPAT
jgi:hypothetical protein